MQPKCRCSPDLGETQRPRVEERFKRVLLRILDEKAGMEDMMCSGAASVTIHPMCYWERTVPTASHGQICQFGRH